MNIKEFNNLSDEAKEYTLNKVLEIIEIVERNPSTIDDLLLFAEWQAMIGKFGENMKSFLRGIYPVAFSLDINRDIVIEESNKALESASIWNKIIKKNN